MSSSLTHLTSLEKLLSDLSNSSILAWRIRRSGTITVRLKDSSNLSAQSYTLRLSNATWYVYLTSEKSGKEKTILTRRVAFEQLKTLPVLKDSLRQELVVLSHRLSDVISMLS